MSCQETFFFFLKLISTISYHWVVTDDPFVPLREHREVECLRSSMLCFLIWSMASSALARAGLSLLTFKPGGFRHQDLVNSKTDITQSWQLLTFSFAWKTKKAKQTEKIKLQFRIIIIFIKHIKRTSNTKK